ncbi:hypothetical protein Nepgr_001355 [Nepenthes gracilis]|uniref:Uncharacterized protein n=1 Tax=Nepenthes gracilis TaxID=150966 RepID=A0AAD3P4A8_NEPGR|nr:hypothetical protein Nepgr_001355 [Nepenthes gracilis]
MPTASTLVIENEVANGAEKWVDRQKFYEGSFSEPYNNPKIGSHQLGKVGCKILNNVLFVTTQLLVTVQGVYSNFFEWEPSKLELGTDEMLDRCFTEVDDDNNNWDELVLPDRSDFTGTAKAKL